MGGLLLLLDFFFTATPSAFAFSLAVALYSFIASIYSSFIFAAFLSHSDLSSSFFHSSPPFLAISVNDIPGLSCFIFSLFSFSHNI
uniref:Uncharacterized protein n=1 Tax=Panstrongylus lignarius TaxID=156445 RepID=A0A224Y2N4_9HEMI